MIDYLTMKFIYKKLKRLGLDKKYIRYQVLPSWWDDKLNKNPVAVLEGAGYIARNLNIDLLSLIIPGVKARLKIQEDEDWTILCGMIGESPQIEVATNYFHCNSGDDPITKHGAKKYNDRKNYWCQSN